jgi:dTMP kinase
MRGALVVLEGIDQAGKMTQARALEQAAHAAGLACAVRHYPDYETRIGALIRAFLADGVALDARARCMLFAANRWEKDAELRHLCETHALVCVDRYTASNVVYGTSQGVDESWLWGLESGLLAADLTVLVDIEPDESRRRKARERDDYERDSRLLDAARAHYARLARGAGWARIDGARAAGVVTRDLVAVVHERLGERFPSLERLR